MGTRATRAALPSLLGIGGWYFIITIILTLLSSCVFGLPEAPTITGFTDVETNHLTISWTTPTSNFPILKYEVQAVDERTTRTLTATESPFVVTCLVPSLNVTFSVRAIATDGAGSWSGEKHYVLPTTLRWRFVRFVITETLKYQSGSSAYASLKEVRWYTGRQQDTSCWQPEVAASVGAQSHISCSTQENTASGVCATYGACYMTYDHSIEGAYDGWAAVGGPCQPNSWWSNIIAHTVAEDGRGLVLNTPQYVALDRGSNTAHWIHPTGVWFSCDPFYNGDPTDTVGMVDCPRRWRVEVSNTGTWGGEEHILYNGYTTHDHQPTTGVSYYWGSSSGAPTVTPTNVRYLLSDTQITIEGQHFTYSTDNTGDVTLALTGTATMSACTIPAGGVSPNRVVCDLTLSGHGTILAQVTRVSDNASTGNPVVIGCVGTCNGESPPPAPTFTCMSPPEGTSLTVNWTTPVSALSVSDYEVHIYDGLHLNETRVISSSSVFQTSWDCLYPGSNYTVRVRASNAAGWGDFAENICSTSYVMRFSYVRFAYQRSYPSASNYVSLKELVYYSQENGNMRHGCHHPRFYYQNADTMNVRLSQDTDARANPARSVYCTDMGSAGYECRNTFDGEVRGDWTYSNSYWSSAIPACGGTCSSSASCATCAITSNSYNITLETGAGYEFAPTGLWFMCDPTSLFPRCPAGFTVYGSCDGSFHGEEEVIYSNQNLGYEEYQLMSSSGVSFYWGHVTKGVYIEPTVQILAVSTTVITIPGRGFASSSCRTVMDTPAVTLSGSSGPSACGSPVYGTTSLECTVTFSSRGSLFIKVDVGSQTSGTVEIGSVIGSTVTITPGITPYLPSDTFVTITGVDLSTAITPTDLTGVTITVAGAGVSSGTCTNAKLERDQVICQFSNSGEGPITASVTRAWDSATTGPVQVGIVHALPTITSYQDLNVVSTWLWLQGTSFTHNNTGDLSEVTVSLILSGGANQACGVSFLNKTHINCTFSFNGPGPILATVTRSTDGASSSQVHVATVHPDPVVYQRSDVHEPITTTSLYIIGTNWTFSGSATSQVSISLTGAVSQTCVPTMMNLTHAYCTSLTVNGPGDVLAQVTRLADGRASGTVKIAQMYGLVSVTDRLVKAPVNASTLTIIGQDFTYGTSGLADVSVALAGAPAGQAACNTTFVNSTMVVCTYTPSGTPGNITATITRAVDSGSSSAVVQTILQDPGLSATHVSQFLSTTSTSLILVGTWFTYGDDQQSSVLVQLAGTSGVSGQCNPVSANISHISCTFTASSNGTIEAIVIRTEDARMSSQVQVATVLPGPSVNIATTTVYHSTPIVTIAGNNFILGPQDTTSPSVVLSGSAGVSGPCSVTSFSMSMIQCQFGPSTTAGTLAAVVTRGQDSLTSGAPVQVGSLTVAGVSVAPPTATVSEGQSQEFTVTISSPPQGYVVFDAYLDHPALSVSSSVNFTTGTWNTPQTITVTYVDNSVPEANVSSMVVMFNVTETDDSQYSGSIDASVSLSSNDNDTNSFSFGTVPQVYTTSGLQTLPSFVTFMAIPHIPTAIVVTASTPSAFSSQPAISLSGTLTFTPSVSAPTGDQTVHVVVVYDSTLISRPVSFAIPFSAVPPIVSSITPSRGPVVGGSNLVITGSNLGNASAELTGITVAGGTCTSFKWVSPSYLECTTPAHTVSSGAVVVTLTTGQATGPTFSYHLPPVLSSISPLSALRFAEASVTLTGARLGLDSSDILSVKIGSQPCQTVQYTSSTEVKCTLPVSSTPTTVAVLLTTESGGQSNSDILFTFVRPSITTLSLSQVSTLGGDVVVVSGLHFAADSSEKVNVTLASGGALCSSVNWVSLGSVSCVTVPAAVNTTGQVVVWTAAGGFSPPSPVGISYVYPRPRVLSLSPSSVGLSSRQTVTITGQYFGEQADWLSSVTLAGVACRTAVRISPSVVTCAPGNTTQPVTGPVVVQTLGGTTTSSALFSFVSTSLPGFENPRPAILAISPDKGDLVGNLTVTVTGVNFGFNASDIRSVTVGGVEVRSSSIIWASQTRVLCRTSRSNLVGPGVVALVTRSGGESEPSFVSFEYVYPIPAIEGGYPRVGTFSGRDEIHIIGEWFSSTTPDSIRVTLGGTPCIESTWVSPTEVLCATPPYANIPIQRDAPSFTVMVNGLVSRSKDIGFRFVVDDLLCKPSCGYHGDCISAQCICQPGYTSPPECIVRNVNVTVNGNRTTEDGEQVFVSVVIQEPPSADIVIPLSSNDTGEGVPSPTSLTFTPDNYDKIQTITVTGVMDNSRDGTQYFALLFLPFKSSDKKFDQITLPELPFPNLDSKPVFDGFMPKISPLNGTNITLTGSNFDEDVSLEIDNVKIGRAELRFVRRSGSRALSMTMLQTFQTQLEPIEKIIFVTPRLTDGGHTVTIRNPTQSTDAYLHVTDDCPEPGWFGRGADCRPCGECEECPGGYHRWPKEQSGCWGGTFINDAEIRKCEIPEACLGGQESGCAQGYTGAYCAACEPGYYKTPAKLCELCPVQETQLAYLFCDILLWVVIALSGAFLEDRENFSHIIAMILHLQTIGGVGELIGHTAPLWIRTMYEFFSLFTGDIKFLKPDCQGHIDYELEFLTGLGYSVAVFIPLFLAIQAMRVGNKVFNQHRGPEVITARDEHYKQRLVRSFSIWGTVMYLATTTRALASVFCVRVGDDYLLYTDLSQNCFGVEHVFVFQGSVVILLVYTLGFPLWQFWHQRANLDAVAERDQAHLHKWDFLYDPFVSAFKYCWAVDFVVSFFLALGDTFLSVSVHVQFPVLILLFTLQSAFIGWKRPYRRGWENPVMICVTLTNLLSILYIYLVELNVMNVIFAKIYGYVIGALVAIVFCALFFVVFYYVFWLWLPRTEYGHKNYYDEDEIGDGYDYEYYTPDGQNIMELFGEEAGEEMKETMKEVLKRTFSSDLNSKGVTPFPGTDSEIDPDEPRLEIITSTNETGSNDSQDSVREMNSMKRVNSAEPLSAPPLSPVPPQKGLQRSSSVPQSLSATTGDDGDVRLTQSARKVIFHRTEVEDGVGLGVLGADAQGKVASKKGILLKNSPQVAPRVLAALQRLSKAANPAPSAAHHETSSDYYSSMDESSGSSSQQ
eukprot:TRINITY_DN582_c0_g1_i1.p1 TRINITY_DN582_c0_g1~~TRINITY_DN582_c0_g1_i1.p1  ORF type:complete len:3105 (-),score=89.98 TRINITY_DN582_c0_g1_i1:80-9394(-)